MDSTLIADNKRDGSKAIEIYKINDHVIEDETNGNRSGTSIKLNAKKML